MKRLAKARSSDCEGEIDVFIEFQKMIIDPEVFAQVVSGGGARSAMAENKAEKVINRDFRPHFMAQLLHK
ncbi:MAG: NAD-binding protein, partial [Bacillus sp. (in: firmicutes)]